MFFWFVGTAVVGVWVVFRDPAFDYRLLVVGAVLPTVLQFVPGGARLLHSVTFSVGLLMGLMLVTAGRRPIRRMLLGLPVGTLLHLVFTGAWTNTSVFWWPFAGGAGGHTPHPVVDRGWWNVPLEVIGLGLLAWIVRRGALLEPGPRARFLRTGQLMLPPR